MSTPDCARFASAIQRPLCPTQQRSPGVSAKALRTALFILAVSCSSVGTLALADETQARQTRRVVVLPFRNETGDPAQAHWEHGIACLLRSGLRSLKSLHVYSSDEITFEMEAADIKPGSDLSIDQARKIGQKFGAPKIVWGKFRNSSQPQLELHIDPSGGAAVRIAKVEGVDWLELLKLATERLLQELQLSPSEKECQRIAERWPRSTSALESYARSLSDACQFRPRREREASLRKALAADGEYLACLSDLSHLLLTLDQPQQAEEYLHRIIALSPEYHNTDCLLGSFHLMLMDNQAAEAAFAAAIKLDTDCPVPLVGLANIQCNQQKLDEGIALFERARAIDPQDASVIAFLAVASAVADNGKARKLIEESEALSHGEPFTELLLVKCAAVLGDVPLVARHGHQFMKLARTRGWGTNDTHEAQDILDDVTFKGEGLAPFQRPKSYSAGELQRELKKRLTPEELPLAVNPLDVTPEMKRWAHDITCDIKPPFIRALFLFDELTSRVTVKGQGGTRTAQETFAAWRNPDEAFSCQEYSKLFVALARDVGLDAFYVHLERDALGRRVNHDCVALFIDGKPFLVDPTWHVFGIKHKEFLVLDDLQAVAHHASQPHKDGKDLARSRIGLKLHPDHAWAKLQLVGALINDGQLDEAAQELKRSFQNDPENADALVFQARIASRGEQSQAVIDLLRRALNRDPENVHGHLLLARELLRTRNLSQAAEHLRRVIDLNESGSWPEQAAEATGILSDIGEVYAADRSKDSTAPELRRKAEAGDLEAQHNLAALLLRISATNDTEALKWLTQSAEKGHTLSQFDLGNLYAEPRFPAHNPTTALKWYRLAAIQGDPRAQFRLGEAFADGKGVPIDQVEAFHWLTLAARSGFADAKYRLRELELFMSADELSRAKERLRQNTPNTALTNSIPVPK